MTPNITGPEGADARRWRSRPTGHTAQEQATSPGGALSRPAGRRAGQASTGACSQGSARPSCSRCVGGRPAAGGRPVQVSMQ